MMQRLRCGGATWSHSWHVQLAISSGRAEAETKKGADPAPSSSDIPQAFQTQSLKVQDFSVIFHGVRFSSRHCAKRAGGQLLRRRLFWASSLSRFFADALAAR